MGYQSKGAVEIYKQWCRIFAIKNIQRGHFIEMTKIPLLYPYPGKVMGKSGMSR